MRFCNERAENKYFSSQSLFFGASNYRDICVDLSNGRLGAAGFKGHVQGSNPIPDSTHEPQPNTTMNTLHLDLALLLREAKQYGLSADNLLPLLRAGSHWRLTAPELDRALRTLADLDAIKPMRGALGGTRWRLTALGGSLLEETGL
jgi:hypothetical protein